MMRVPTPTLEKATNLFFRSVFNSGEVPTEKERREFLGMVEGFDPYRREAIRGELVGNLSPFVRLLSEVMIAGLTERKTN